MKSWAELLLVAVALFLALAAPAAEHSPTLDALIASTPAGKPIPVVLFLDNRLTLDDIYPVATSLPLDGSDARRQYVIQSLQTRFQAMGSRVMEHLDAAKKTGQVTILRPLWILNAVRVSATAQVLDEVEKNLPEVTYIANDAEHENTLDDVAWGVADMDVPRVWTVIGANGSGVIVAHKDAGLDIYHPGFAGHLWINPGEDVNHDGAVTAADSNDVDDDGDGYVDDFWGWCFDQDNNNVRDNPRAGSSFGHGTKTASVISSTNLIEPCDTVSVAPGAKLMELSAFLSQGAVWEASQYAIMKGAQVMSASLSFKQSDCDASTTLDCPNRVAHRMVSEMELAAGLIHANSAGNQLSQAVPLSMPSPADSPPPAMTSSHPIHGGVSSIVSVNAYSLSGGLSSGAYGPSAWTRADVCVHSRMAFCGPDGHGNAFPYSDYPYNHGAQRGLLKPDISAPTGVASLSPGGGCGSIGGTSGATPHVGGALALIYSKFPGISPEAAYLLIANNWYDLGLAGADTAFGFGKIKPFPACSSGVENLTWLSGTITGPNGPLADVRVSTPGADPVFSGPAGVYNLWLAADSHYVAFEKYGYSDVVYPMHAGGGTITHNVSMSAGVPATVTLTAMGNGAPQSQIPVSIPKIPFEGITGDVTGSLSVDVFAGRYLIIYGALPWNVDTLVADIPPGPSSFALNLTRSPRTLPTGPDGGHYYVYDNNDTPEAAFQWVEINANAGGLPGTVLSTGGDGSVVQALPFTFRYYGADYTSITVSASGFVMMGGAGSQEWAPQPIPSTLPPNAYAAPFFEDWEPQRAGSLVLYFAQLDSHRVIIEWYNVQNYDSSGRATFEAILYDPAFAHGPTNDGVIRFQYNMVAGRNAGSIGLENLQGTDGLQYLFQLQYDPHASPVQAGMSLLITTDSTLGPAAVDPSLPPTLPKEFVLNPNYPNPFNPTTTFSWSVPHTAMVRLALYDILGREAAVVFDGISTAGSHVQVYDASRLGTGMYFARLEAAGKSVAVRKVLLLK